MIAYVTQGGDAIAIMKDQSEKLQMQTLAFNAVDVDVGDWDDDGLAEEVCISAGKDGKELRLFKLQRDGRLKEIATGKLPTSLPPVKALNKGYARLESSGQTVPFVTLIKVGERIVPRMKQRPPFHFNTDLDSDGRCESITVFRHEDGNTLLQVRWGGSRQSTTKPIAQSDWHLQSAGVSPLRDGEKASSLFLLWKQDSRWKLEILSFDAAKHHWQRATVAMGQLNFVPTWFQLLALADHDGDGLNDVSFAAHLPGFGSQSALIFTRQTLEGWKAFVTATWHEATKSISLAYQNKFVWFVRRDVQQKLARTLTYWRLHTVWVHRTDLLTLQPDGKWKLHAELKGSVGFLWGRFSDLDGDDVPELVTVDRNFLDLGRVLFWKSTPPKGWQIFDISLPNLEQLQSASRVGAPPELEC